MRVAVAQIEPKLGEKERNLEACLARLEAAAAAGAELLVLPECAIPGYMFDSAAEALRFAEEIPGPSTEVLAAACRRLVVHVVCGLLEFDGEQLHNSAVLVGPDGLIGSYRKTHLPFLGVDRFTVPGDVLPGHGLRAHCNPRTGSDSASPRWLPASAPLAATHRPAAGAAATSGGIIPEGAECEGK